MVDHILLTAVAIHLRLQEPALHPGIFGNFSKMEVGTFWTLLFNLGPPNLPQNLSESIRLTRNIYQHFKISTCFSKELVGKYENNPHLGECEENWNNVRETRISWTKYRVFLLRIFLIHGSQNVFPPTLLLQQQSIPIHIDKTVIKYDPIDLKSSIIILYESFLAKFIREAFELKSSWFFGFVVFD